MDCRIRDCRIIHNEGSIVSVPPDYLVQPVETTGTLARSRKYYMKIQWHEVHWQDDGTTSIVDIDILQLETLMPKKQVSNETPRCSKGKFNLRIKPACPLPDSTDDEDAGMNFEVMASKRFERIIAFIQLSGAIDADQPVLDFVAAVNDNFQKSVSPGSFLTLDESMVKLFHHNLKGKIKIIRKPRPIGNEIKNMADGLSNIVLNMEVFDGKDLTKNKYAPEVRSNNCYNDPPYPTLS